MVRRDDRRTGGEYPAGVAGAAFFDLDRTLLRRRVRARCSPRPCATAGFTVAAIPGERLLYGLFNRDRRDAAVDGARPPGGGRWPRAARGRRAGRRRGGGRDAGGDGAAVRLAAASPSTAPPAGRSCWPPPRRTTWSSRSADRLGFDDVIATRYGVDADGTFDGTIDGPFVWAAGKLRRRAGVGRRARRRPRRELRLLRQRVRRPAAVGGGPPGRRQPRSAHGRDGHRCAAGRSSTSTCRRACPKLPCSASSCSRWRCSSPARADALRPLRHRRASSTSRPRARRSSSATTAATSTPARWPSSSPAAGAPCASSARRRCSTRRSSASSPGHGRHPRRPRHRLRRAAAGGGRRRSRAARWWRSCRRARSRGVRRSSTPCSRGAGARPGWRS